MKTTPSVYFGRSPYSTSRIGEFISELERKTDKQPNDFLFIDPYSIGDCVQSLGLLPNFRRIYCNEGQRIIFLCQERAQKLSLVMPYADVAIGMDLGPHELALEYIASLSNFLSPAQPIICATDMHALGKVVRTTAPPMNLKRAIFFLNQGEPHFRPVVSDTLREAINRKMDALGVIQHRSIIFFPHAFTFHDFGPEFWGGVVVQLRARVPDVAMFTDVTVGGPTLPGTTGISLSLEEIIPAIEYAGSGVFLRSGLVEVCAWTTANVVSVVPPRELYRYMPQGVVPESTFVHNFYPDTTVRDIHVPSRDAAEIERLAATIAAGGGLLAG